MIENASKKSGSNFTFYPLLWLFICFAFGILFAKTLNLNWQIYLIVSVLSALTAIFFIKRDLAVILLFIAYTAIGGLYFQIENQPPAADRLKRLYDESFIKSGDPIEIEGILQKSPELAVGGFFIEVKTEKAVYKSVELDVSGIVRLFAAPQSEEIADEYRRLDLKSGSRVAVAGHLEREDRFLNPGVVPSRQILDQSGIDATGVIKSPLLVEKLGEAKSFAPLRWLYDWRESLVTGFSEKFSLSTAGVLIASLLGNRNFLNKETAEVFREGGTFHILVISGLHITFIGGLTLFFVGIFTKKRFWQFALATALLWTYSIAVGAEIPVVRAALMFTILLFSQVVRRKGNLLNALGACGLVLLVWRPNDIFNASFQLTFISVAGIVAAAFPLIENLRTIGAWSPTAAQPFPPNVSRRLRRFCETIYWRENVWEIESKRRLWTAKIFKKPYLKQLKKRDLGSFKRYIFEAVIISAVAQIWLLPLIIFYFHRLSFFSILLNLWVGTLIALESFAAIIAVTLAHFSEFAALPFINLTEFFNWLLLFAPKFLVVNNLASVRVPHYSGALKAIYFLYFAPLLLTTMLLNRWDLFSLKPRGESVNLNFFRRAAVVSVIVIAALIVFHPFSAPSADGRLHIDFLDVGQGDAALITFPDGETMLIDGGGKMNLNKKYAESESEDEPELFEPDRQNIGETVVSAYLWGKGYDEIDYIAATHADADHIQGLSDVAKNFKVRAAMFGRTPLKNSGFSDLYAILEKRDVPIIVLVRNDVLNFGGAQVEILSPERNTSADAVSDNNHSLVMRVTYGERTFLLTGDIEKEAEKDLLNAPELLRSDVVKVAHHGSRTSSTPEFVGATKAKLAVISVGASSPFGHPNEEIVQRWIDSGAKILTTGERGTISVSTDGTDLRLKTFVH